MIVYRENVENFISACDSGAGSTDIAEEISDKMRFCGISYFDESQVKAWNASLPEMAKVLELANIDSNIDVAIEYKPVQSRDRIDFLVCGDDDYGRKNVVVVELKQWSSVRDTSKPDHVFTFGGHGEGNYWHPSYQAYNYAQILYNFNEYVRNENVGIPACSYLHNMPEGNSVLLDNTKKYPLVQESPVFYKGQAKKLGQYITHYVQKANNKILDEIEHSNIVPSAYLADMLSDAINGNPFFSYDEAQANSIAEIVETAIDSAKYGGKRTIIIKGGAGSGKSVVAINALGQLINNTESGKRINAVYASSTAAPRRLYGEELHRGDFTKKSISNLFKYPTVFCHCGDDKYDCTLVDEAHRVFDFKGGVGIKSGTHVLDDIIRASKVSVFFIDADQAVTTYDFADVSRIKDAAERMHSKVIEGKDLELTSQFRVTGGETYISFIKSLLGYNDDVRVYKPEKYDFRVFDSAKEMADAIKEKDSLYNDGLKVSGKCRLVAGYTYEWNSKNQFRDGPDYDIVLDSGDFKAKWNLQCNEVGNDYSWLNDPLSVNEVGCIHTCQGLDLNYCGVIIGTDLQYIDGKLSFHKENIAKSDRTSGIRTAPDDLAEKLIRNTYHVLLTRGMLGTYVYCEDVGLREYIKSMLKND